MKKVFVFFALIFSLSLKAHVPLTGQIARHQSHLLASEKAFRVSGAALVPGKSKMPLEIIWLGPSHYMVSLSNISKSFYRDGEPSSKWELYRQGRICNLKTDSQTVNCPSADIWAILEFSGHGEWAARALVDKGFYADSDAQFTETDSRTYKVLDKKDQRVSVVLGSNGSKPVAPLEIRGPNFNTDSLGEEYPLIQFDQTFLSPLLARFKFEGDIISIRASADLEVRRGHPRFKYILSDRVDLSFNKNLVASFIRSPLTPLGQKTPKVLSPKSITDLSSLRDVLSSEGQLFLKAFLLVH